MPITIQVLLLNGICNLIHLYMFPTDNKKRSNKTINSINAINPY